MQRIVTNAEISEKEFPRVTTFDNSTIFYKNSPPVESPMLIAGRTIGFHGGEFKCAMCGNKSKHNSQSGYCYIHKRIVDMNESCPMNTWKSGATVRKKRDYTAHIYG
jgi:hypothetical protein